MSMWMSVYEYCIAASTDCRSTWCSLKGSGCNRRLKRRAYCTKVISYSATSIMSYKLVVFYRDILSGPWVTLLELIPGSSIIMNDSPCGLLPCKAWHLYANAHAHILQRRNRSDVAAPSQRRRSAITATSERCRSAIAATLERRRRTVAAPSQRHRTGRCHMSLRHVGNAFFGHHRFPTCRSDVAPMSLQWRCDVALMSLRQRRDVAPMSLRRRCDVAPMSPLRRCDVAPLQNMRMRIRIKMSTGHALHGRRPLMEEPGTSSRRVTHGPDRIFL